MVHLTKIIAAVLVLAGLALGIYAWTLSRQPVPSGPPVAAAKASYAVVVADKSLPAGQAIKAEDLRIERLPMQPTDAFHDPQLVVGRVPIIDMSAGAPIVDQQLASGLSIKIAEGERAVAVKVDEAIGVGHKVRPGDFVDVFFVLKRDGHEIDSSQARLLLSRKRVLAYGASSVDGVQKDPSQTAGGARTAILAVPVEEVNPILLGEANGRLLLALRNPKDTAEPDPKTTAPWMMSMVPAPRHPSQTRPPAASDHAAAGTALSTLAGRAKDSALPVHAVVTQRANNRPVDKRPAALDVVSVEFIRGAKQEIVTY
ncbi:Flp pilus assembly protein CpaB [Polaromonas sp. SM01]|uniref:Flp pilus assembly protein CpaB n=1 Tax=Polaromonas sp. SM01 TaxID=3085630 RepID=UPI0029824EFD|nr:Flp pilus assembly protein CpaB [Polaromonas sp. SM01]MDW5441685.1 Flp pilus assembly protein CpaB [Polaromonas sp. SM01]